MKKDIVRQILVVVAIVATLAVNVLANALPINGVTTGEVSDSFDVYFVPAGYVFAIWGLIYIGLIAFGVYQVLPAQREDPALRRIGYLVIASCVANIAWLFLWHYSLIPFTIVAMFVLLTSLIFIYLELENGLVPAASPAEKWCVRVPVSVYLGWITVATVANVTSLLYYVNWRGWGIDPEVWAAIMLLVATGISAAVSITRGDVAYSLVIAWAFAGIASRHARTPIVAASSLAATVIVLALLLVGAYLPHPAPKRETPEEEDEENEEAEEEE